MIFLVVFALLSIIEAETECKQKGKRADLRCSSLMHATRAKERFSQEINCNVKGRFLSRWKVNHRNLKVKDESFNEKCYVELIKRRSESAERALINELEELRFMICKLKAFLSLT